MVKLMSNTRHSDLFSSLPRLFNTMYTQDEYEYMYVRKCILVVRDSFLKNKKKEKRVEDTWYTEIREEKGKREDIRQSAYIGRYGMYIKGNNNK
jgi:hypothetical protein